MLNRRQRLLYEDWFDIYEPLDLTKKTGSTRLQDRKVSATPVATNVRGLFLSKPESSSGGNIIGRTDKDNLFTLDSIRIAADQLRDNGSPLLIDDGFFFRLATPGHPDEGGWWVCQGGSKIRIRRARRDMNIQTVSALRTTKPYGVT